MNVGAWGGTETLAVVLRLAPLYARRPFNRADETSSYGNDKLMPKETAGVITAHLLGNLW